MKIEDNVDPKKKKKKKKKEEKMKKQRYDYTRDKKCNFYKARIQNAQSTSKREEFPL